MRGLRLWMRDILRWRRGGGEIADAVRGFLEDVGHGDLDCGRLGLQTVCLGVCKSGVGISMAVYGMLLRGLSLVTIW